jgi:hypothetical protein
MKPYAVCLIGSSHTSALFHAWKNRPFSVQRDFSLTFFAAAGKRLGSLRLDDGVLLPEEERVREMFVRTSGGKDRIVPADYDAIVIYAFGLRFADDVLEFCRNYGTAEHEKHGPVETLLSADCFASAIATLLSERGAVKYLADIRAIYDRPLLICPTPLPPRDVLRENFSEPRFSEPLYLSSVLSVFTSAAESLCAKHGGEIVWQDERTIDRPCFTKETFSLGSTGFSGRQREGYNKHLNENYGALELARLLERLNELSDGRVLKAKTVPNGALSDRAHAG